MMLIFLRRIMAVIAISFLSVLLHAQPSSKEETGTKPYKILTSGKQITVKSNKNISNIMVWTASGHRIVEQREVNEPSFSFNVSNVNEKVFFIMILYEGKKPFTEKIGI